MKKTLTAAERRFVDRSRVCRVGSVDCDGSPHVAPLCHAFEGRTFYVATDRDGRTARNLRKRSRATIACDEYFEDWNRIRGVVTHATARRIERGPELERARRLLTRKFRQYSNDDIDYVIALRVREVTSWGL